MDTMLLAISGAMFTYVMTTLGASAVFFTGNAVPKKFTSLTLGFAAGIMIAASVWSLLLPAIEQAEQQGLIPWVPAAGGFALGVGFLLLLDVLLPHFHPQSNCHEGIKTDLKRSSLLFIAVTMHNIPEGMAVGLSFALAMQNASPELLTQALVLALGIGIQNIPEGAALSLPLKTDGFSRLKAFVYGSLSGIVEPIFAILTIFFAAYVIDLMPWLLSFAAGAMMYVVVEELIPEAQLDEHSNIGTLSVMAGFLMMMILDIALG